MNSELLVDLSRLQFAATAFYHFLFVPLTIGLAFLMAIMETVYVKTGNVIYRDMTKFWGKLFGINFAMGIATGITLEFQFGTNWAYYSHYVGDIFGAPLAIEGLLAFFLESTMVGIFFFGWDRLSKRAHLMVTYLVAIGSNLSAILILIANGWMQHPVAARFNPVTMRMEMSSFLDIVLNPVAQSKFVHTITAGYVTGAFFVLGISAWYLLKGRDIEFARRSFRIAAVFGLISSVFLIIYGDESGYHVAQTQPTKLAAMEAIWKTEPAPAGITALGFPDERTRTTHAEIRIPYVLGIINTRSLDTTIPGFDELEAMAERRIKSGMIAVKALERLRKDPGNVELLKEFEAVKDDLGYGLLLKRYVADVSEATPEMIAMAVGDTIPSVLPLFLSFRAMVGIGILMFGLLLLSTYCSLKNKLIGNVWLLRGMLFAIPLPWIASELGWFVAEYGRQPWTIYEILPTHLSTSVLTEGSVMFSLAGFVIFYTLLLVVELFLMFKYARLGPSSLGTGEYFHEQAELADSTRER